MELNIVEFIKRNVIVDPETNCWNWNKSTNSSGYGQFTRNKKYWTAHRFVYSETFGEIPDGMLVRHKCHNTKCCNPEHLIVGTDKDNWWDSENKYRDSANRRAKGYIINGVTHRTFQEAKRATKMSGASLVKYTDKVTRIFNVEAYRNGCKIANCAPKI